MAGCAEGKSVAELCALGDNTINELLSKVYKGKKMEKGIAFPTCISINNCCGHFSPLKEDSVNFKKGDVAKMYDSPPPTPTSQPFRCIYFLKLVIFVSACCCDAGLTFGYDVAQ